MSKRKFKVTIGLPVYNGERHLARTLENLLAQRFSDFELLISDNASTDRTAEICRQFAARDPRIRYVRQQSNIGSTPNFNAVFLLSDSPYFKWAAVDDVCDPTFLEKAVAVLDAEPGVAWCHSRSSHIDGEGALLDDSELLDVSYAERGEGPASARFNAVLLGKGGCLDSYGLFRSEMLRKTPIFLPGYGSEKVLIAELALLGRYAEIPETLFFSRVAAEGSGSIDTAAGQQAFSDPSRPYAAYLARFIFLGGYLRAIWRSAPGWRQRLACHLVVLRWLMQVSKWKSVIVRTIRGQGVGGVNVARLSPKQSHQGATANLPQQSGTSR